MVLLMDAGTSSSQGNLQIVGFEAFGGRHCETSALSKVLGHAGLPYSEAMIFGLAGGMGFIYWSTKNMPIPFIGGRNGRFPDFLATACRRLGIGFAVRQSDSPVKGFRDLREEIAAGRPVVVYGDIAYLPYFGTPRHFGGHAFVVYGIDESTGVVLVSDRGRGPCCITLDDLARARSSEHGPFAPRHAQLRLQLPATAVGLGPAVRDAIAATCTSLLNPPIRNLGLCGIRRFADELPLWVKRYSGSQLVDVLMESYVNLELAGTGGGAFRRLYADFLREACVVLNEPELQSIAASIDDAADRWRDIATGLLPDEIAPLAQCRQLLDARNCLFEEQGGDYAEGMQEINVAMAVAKAGAYAEIEESALRELLGQVRVQLLNLREFEEETAMRLAAVVR